MSIESPPSVDWCQEREELFASGGHDNLVKVVHHSLLNSTTLRLGTRLIIAKGLEGAGKL